MEGKYERIERFLNTLTELVEGKYITADTTISEALSQIAGSRELTAFFTAMTQGFDYARARRDYLRFPATPGAAHGAFYLPTDRKEIAAFVFCLFVEFDAGTIQFGDFLLRYFYEDGSYTASYLLFADRVLRPFREIVQDGFPALKRHREHDELRRRREEIFAKLAQLLPAEEVRLARFKLQAAEQAAAELLLAGLNVSVGRQDVQELTALLAGYRYFLRYFGGEDEASAAIFELAGKL